MGSVVEAAMTPWGIATLVAAALAVVAFFALRGQLRLFAVLALAATTVLLGAVATMMTAPPPEVGSEALAGLQTDIPDSDRDLAERLLARALTELNTGDSTSARDTYDQARSLFRNLGDILGEGKVAYGLGQLEHFTGQSDRARANYSEALSLFRQGGSARLQAIALAAMGDLEKDTFNWADAAAFYREARAQWARAPKPKETDHVLLRMADAPMLPDEEAREILDQADKIYANLEDAEGLGDVKMLVGDLERNQGRHVVARTYYADARLSFRDASAAAKEAHSTLRVASVDLNHGYNELVALGLELAEGLFEEVADTVGLAQVLLLRGDLARLLGHMEQARNHYAEAVAAFADRTTRGTAEATLKLGQVQAWLGAATAARETLDRAAIVAHRAEADDLRAAALLAEGIVARENGSPPAAESRLADSASRFERIGAPVGQGRALLELAHVDRLLGRPESAAERVAAAEALFRQADSPVGRTLALLERGTLARAAEDPETAAVAFQSAVDLFGHIGNHLVAANVFLDLPAIDTLRVRTATEITDIYDELAYSGPEDLTPESLAAIAANLAAHPDHLVEGRALVAEIERRLAEADAFVRERQ